MGLEQSRLLHEWRSQLQSILNINETGLVLQILLKFINYWKDKDNISEWLWSIECGSWFEVVCTNDVRNSVKLRVEVGLYW